MCGPRGSKFLKPIELQIPHFISIDGQSWSYAFKANDSLVGKETICIFILNFLNIS